MVPFLRYSFRVTVGGVLSVLIVTVLGINLGGGGTGRSVARRTLEPWAA
jgi:hypothetical protein